MTEFFRTLIAALAGALVGGFVAELRGLLEVRRERRRALCTLLYQLLEVRHRVSITDPSTLEKVLRNSIDHRVGTDAARQLGSPEGKRQLRQLIQALGEEHSGKPIADAYQQAVDAIAPYDPILAYRIRDFGKLADLGARITQYFDRLMVMPEIAASPHAQLLRPSIEWQTSEVAYSEALIDLAKQIRLIAWRIGPLTSFRIRSVLFRQSQPSDGEAQSQLDQVLNKVVINDSATK